MRSLATSRRIEFCDMGNYEHVQGGRNNRIVRIDITTLFSRDGRVTSQGRVPSLAEGGLGDVVGR
jgi:hypothetical protein